MFGGMGQTNVKNLGNGGTIDGDLTISGDLTVSGGGSLSFDEIIEGTQVIDITNTEAFLVRKNGDGGDVMVVDTTNSRVGIGKAPDTLLHLYSTSASKPILKIENEQGGSNPVSIQMLRNTNSPADDDFIGQIDFRSMNDAGTPEEILYAYISSQSTDITDGTEDGEINFFTMKAGTLTNTMTMQSGNVGIGNESPSTMLHLKSSASSKPILTIEDTNADDNFGALKFVKDSASPSTSDKLMQIWAYGDNSNADQVLWSEIATLPSSVTDGSEEGTIRFRTLAGSDSLNQTMTIKGATVGINETAPDEMLHVKASSGNVYAKVEAEASNSSAGLRLVGGNNDESRIHFGDSDDVDIGKIVYIHGSTNAMAFTTNTAEAMRITSGGVLLLGHTSSTNTGNLTAQAQIETTGSGSALAITRNTNGAFGSYLVLAKTRSSTVGGSTILQDDDEIGTVRFSGADGNDRASHACEISGQVDGTPGSNDMPGRLVFKTTADGANSATERMRITSDGSVGIGETAPVAELHIKQGSAGDVDTHANVALVIEGTEGTFLQFQTASSATDVGLLFGDPGERDAGAIKYDHTNDSFKFHTDDVEKLRLRSDGELVVGGDSGIAIPELTLKSNTTGNSMVSLLAFKDSGNTERAYVGYGSSSHSHLNFYNSLGDLNFYAGSANIRFVLDDDSRISLSNNDASGAVGTTLFGKSAGLNIPSGALDNTFIGHEVAAANTITSGADSNTGVGFKALSPLTSGTANTMIGYRSGFNINTGSYNTAVGNDTLKNCNDGTYNVAIGRSANEANAGDYNVAVGALSLINNTASNNTAVGYKSGNAITSGTENVAIGYQALMTEDTGDRNTAVGYEALKSLDHDGDGYNVAIGYKALTSATGTGIENVAIGGNAGLAISGGHENVFIGSGSGASTTATDESILIGYHAGQGANITVDGIIGIGYQALQSLTSGSGSTVVGYQAGKSINVGDQNTAFGYQALMSADTGEYNVAVGYQALLDNVDGSHNTAVGRLALENFEPSSANEGHNSALGSLAGNDVSTGTFNTTIGSNAGHDGTNNLTTGNYNSFLGAYTNGSGSGASNQTVIGYNANGQANNSVVLGNSDVTQVFMADDSGAQVNCGRVQAFHPGNGSDPVLHVKDTQDTLVAKFEGNRIADTGAMVRIFHNPSSPATSNRTFLQFTMLDAGSAETIYAQLSTFIGDNTDTQEDGNLRFSVMNNGTLTEHLRIDFDGDMTATNTTIASNSDERLKENIADYSGGLDIITKLRPVTFEYKDSKRKQGTIRGFVAQEVKEVDDYWIGSYTIDEKIDGVENPEYEYVKDTDGQSLTSKISAKDTMYVSAIQELLAKIDALEVRIKELESK